MKNAYCYKYGVFVHKLLKFPPNGSCDGPVECCADISYIVFKLKSCAEAICMAVNVALTIAAVKCVECAAIRRCAWVLNKGKCVINIF